MDYCICFKCLDDSFLYIFTEDNIKKNFHLKHFLKNYGDEIKMEKILEVSVKTFNVPIPIKVKIVKEYICNGTKNMKTISVMMFFRDPESEKVYEDYIKTMTYSKLNDYVEENIVLMKSFQNIFDKYSKSNNITFIEKTRRFVKLE